MASHTWAPSFASTTTDVLDEPSKGGNEALTIKALWMLDSEASTYMTGDPLLFSHIQTVSRVAIDLPNMAQTLSTKQGLVALQDGTKINNVLLVPKLSCDLISIARITKDLNYSVIFFDDRCVL